MRKLEEIEKKYVLGEYDFVSVWIEVIKSILG
jgi:hypothetical protein